MTSNYYNPADPNLIYLQSRAEVDPALIEEYAEAMAAGAQFPALKAIGEQHTLYIYDGYHRGQAAQKTGLPLLVSVKPGTRAEAEWLALAANQEDGLRRSNADKQKIVRLALGHDFGAKLSDRQLAAHCGVSDKTVGKIRAELVATAEIPQSATRLGADGREINVGNIGKGAVENSPIGEKVEPPAPTEACSACGRPGRFDTYGTGRRICFQCWIRSPQHKAAGTPAPPQPAPTEDPAAELRKQLGRALRSDSGRWAKARQTGSSNAELMEAIGKAFGIEGGASGDPGGGYYCKGLRNPRFWLDFHNYSSRPPTLAGAALRDAVRELLGIPFPAEATEGEGDYDFTAMTPADLEAGLAAIERDGLPLDSPHARRLREELAARQNGAAPDQWQPSTPGLAHDLAYRQQQLYIRFATLVKKIKDITWIDDLDRRLGELEAEIAGDPAKIKNPAS